MQRFYVKRRKKNYALRAVLATTVAAAGARRGKDRRQGAVFVQTVQKGDDDGKGATAEQVAADKPVFIAKDEDGDEQPKGTVPVRTTIHKRPPKSPQDM